jgi:hypothetical protein
MDWLDKAIRKAGGYREVSRLSGVSEYHLRNAGTGRRGIGIASVAKLRPVLPKVPEKRWLEALGWSVSRKATVGHDAAHMEGANVAPSSVNDAEAA